MTPEERFRRLVDAAGALAAEHRWEESGRAWIEAGRVAVDAGALPQARAALDVAAEAFRRDDRLADAEKAGRMLLRFGPTPQEAALARVRLAGVLGELGRTAEALAEIDGLAQGPAPPPSARSARGGGGSGPDPVRSVDPADPEPADPEPVARDPVDPDPADPDPDPDPDPVDPDSADPVDPDPVGPVGSLAALVLDTRIGLLWQVGRKDQVRPLVEALAHAEGEGGFATSFRRGQLARMDGALAEAASWYERVIERLTGREGAEAGIAAARSELGEIELLQGWPQRAIDAYEHGRALHEAAGRTALALRAEAGRVRAAVQAGLEVLPGRLEEGLRYARDRGLVVLQVDLWLGLGVALAARDPEQARVALEAAVADADRLGLRLQSGRGRLELALRVPQPRDRRLVLLRRAAEELADNVPLRDRALAAAAG